MVVGPCQECERRGIVGVGHPFEDLDGEHPAHVDSDTEGQAAGTDPDEGKQHACQEQRNECVQVQQRLQQGHAGIEQQHEAAGPVQAMEVQLLLGLQEVNQ